ncbi:GDP-L-fucose synthase [uncultured archaeon]|nr:GDP-L-fucose synthase [uncultured archaeon]
MKVLVTGGCGFIGSNFIRYLLTSNRVPSNLQVKNLDLMTYAGRGKNIEHMNLANNSRYSFVKADICDPVVVRGIYNSFDPEVVFHFAAESHVDRSNQNNAPFKTTNILGTQVIAEEAKHAGVSRFIHISTDEVYGSIKEGSFLESSTLNPTNPYAETKARAEEEVRKIGNSGLGLDYIITRSANNYGPYQFPEKLLPLFITNLIDGKPVPLMWSEKNPGLNVRDWLHVEDNCRAIWYVSQNGNAGEVYNIPGDNERTNIDMTRKLLYYFGLPEELIEKVPHRSSHDFRYSISGDKLKALGFKHEHLALDHEVNRLCSWYENNPEWWRPLKK